jgi:hypothetical protein
MSFYEDSTYYSVKSGWIKARKPHVCKDCGATIAKGERYWGVTMHWTTYRYGQLHFCAFCHARYEWQRAEQTEKV